MRFSRLADWLSWQETLHPTAIDLGLDRLRTTLDQLGWRQPTCPVITIGGTNGKGSSVALLSQILACAGYRVGAFTSPHLLRYNERIVIDGREISDASLMAAFERIDDARGAQTLTFFEFNALAALLVFETAGLDVIILEVGMGGRLDAVNVVDADVAFVTSIALDHCDWLGGDVETIGREKAGIFRAHRPAVFGSMQMPASVRASAEQLGSDLLTLGADFGFTRTNDGWSWWGSNGAARFDDLPAPALFGETQLENAAAVLQVLGCLASRLPVSRAAIESGLRTVRLNGRFQIVALARADGVAIDWILDVAHNPAAAKTLADQLRLQGVRRRTIAVCGILGDKDIDGIAALLRESFDEWLVAGLEGARAVAPEELAARLRQCGANVVATAASVEVACVLAEQHGRAGDRIVVFGSFLTVGPALEWLEKKLAGNTAA
jgi:dihydrofolate synthase / folylpolyglutamate synthase